MNNYIKKRRLELGLTQEELAQQVGARRETIVFLEAGKYNPSLKLAAAVSRVLKTPIEDLFELD